MIERLPFVRRRLALAWSQGYATAEYDAQFDGYRSLNPYLYRVPPGSWYTDQGGED